MNDYYADLGVARDATADEIKKAYRKAARRLHPDVNTGPGAEEQFKKVSQAYDVLSDEEKRRSFDMGADPYAGAAGAGFGQGFCSGRRTRSSAGADRRRAGTALAHYGPGAPYRPT